MTVEISWPTWTSKELLGRHPAHLRKVIQPLQNARLSRGVRPHNDGERLQVEVEPLEALEVLKPSLCPHVPPPLSASEPRNRRYGSRRHSNRRPDRTQSKLTRRSSNAHCLHSPPRYDNLVKLDIRAPREEPE